MRKAAIRNSFLPLARAVAIVVPVLLAVPLGAPASAQVSVSISFNDFHNRLAPYGTWSRDARWGDVWRPRAGSDFKPYYDGHWEDTNEYGWLWVSNENWGDVTYHYGRWLRDPREGWLWVPGYVWGPSWVVWRSGGGNIGWFPMPPGDNYYGDGAYRDDFDSEYGYRNWYGPTFGTAQFLALWIFVGENHFRDNDFRNYAVPQRDYGRFISQTRDATNYATVNNYVVNRSVDPVRLQQDTKQRFAPVPARNVIGRNPLVTQAAVGRQVEQRERQQHPIPAAVTGQTAPAARPPQQSTNPGQQRDQGRGNQGGRSAGQVNPQVTRTAPATPSAPVARAPQQNATPAQQNDQGRRSNGNPAIRATPGGPQATRPAPGPAANAPQSTGNQALQATPNRGSDRGSRANGVAPTPTAPRAAPAATAPAAPPAPVTPARPNGNRGGQSNQLRGSGTPAPQAGAGSGNRAQDNGQGDTKKASGPASADDGRNAGRGRGQN